MEQHQEADERPTARVALLACGALAKDVAEVVARCAWPVDIHGISAFHHMEPKKIVRDAETKLADLSQRYERVVVVYGDCGTFGALDDVIARYPAVRPAGMHCYEWFAETDFPRLQDDEPGAFFLTDWLVQNWDLAVIRGLGLDRFPYLKDTYFRHLTLLLFFTQTQDATLLDAARRIAEYLDVPLEVRDTGTGPLERILAKLVDSALPVGI
ncbi:MAG: DUF1638 domain-containing protein [Actinomycetes bacterium]